MEHKIELIVSEIQKKCVLWTKFDTRYRDRIIADKEWNIVAKRTNMDSKNICYKNSYVQT